jgi:hypothetical protein
VVEPGTASEEKILVTRTGSTDTTINVASDSERGQDGTSAVSHSTGSTVFPVFTSVDADEANAVASVISADTTNGRIGIGVASPGQTLHVVSDGGNLSSGDVSDETKGTIHLQNSGGTNADGALSTGISFGGVNTGRRRALVAAFQDGADGDPHGLQFFTYGSTSSASDAVTARMTIASSGKVGIGTTTPLGELDINGNTAQLVFSSPSGTNRYRFDANMTDAVDYGFSVGYWNGSSWVRAITLRDTSYVGISTDSPADRLQVGDAAALGSFRVHASGGGESFRVAANVVRSYNIYNLTTGNAANVHIASNGTMYRSTSSGKYKTDVETLDDDHADIIFRLRPVWFRSTTGNDPESWSYYGLIAEEVAEVDPRLVHFGPSTDCQCEPDDEGHVEHVLSCLTEPEGVQYDRLVPHLISVVQRQQAQIDALEARLAALEAK